MIEMWSGIDMINKGEERLINNMNINSVVGE